MNSALALTDTDWQLAAELARLALEAETAERALAQTNAAVAHYVADIHARFAAEIAEVESASLELQAFLAERQAREQARTLKWRTCYAALGQRFHTEPPPQPSKPARNRKRAAKKLYQSIAMRCHPDRIEDPELHEIFIQAQAALAADDVPRLKALWDACKGGLRKGASAYDLRRARLRARRKALAARKAEIEAELAALQGSTAYVGMQAVADKVAEIGQDGADAMIRDGFAAQAGALRARLQQMRQPAIVRPQFQFYTYATSSTPTPRDEAPP